MIAATSARKSNVWKRMRSEFPADTPAAEGELR